MRVYAVLCFVERCALWRGVLCGEVCCDVMSFGVVMWGGVCCAACSVCCVCPNQSIVFVS